MLRLGVILMAALVSMTAGSQAAPKCGISSLPTKFPANENGVQIATSTTADALLFKLRPGQMSLDLDGNAHTYGVKDQGIDTLCNGLSALTGKVQLAFIHGSMAEGRETAASDVDVMVVGKKLSLQDIVSALTQAEISIGRVVNPSVYGSEELCRKL